MEDGHRRAVAAATIGLAPSSIRESAKRVLVRGLPEKLIAVCSEPVHVCYLEIHASFGISPVVPHPFYLRRNPAQQVNNSQFVKFDICPKSQMIMPSEAVKIAIQKGKIDNLSTL